MTRATILGFLAGLILGLGDYWLLRAIDVSMTVDGEDVTLWIVLLFALNFGALGGVIARLWERGNELQALQRSLVEAETLAAVGRMAAGVAHEVRNPLSVIRSSAQMLAEDLGEREAEAASFICTEVDRLDGFVGRVLDFSRPLDARPAAVEFAEIRRRLGPVVGPQVVFEGEERTFELDPDLTVQLLSNLVDNAWKSEAREVRICAREGAIDVVDDGQGVAREVRETLFEPFVTNRAQGTGLGLAMARKLARVQGWDLELADAPVAGGACFRFVRRAMA